MKIGWPRATRVEKRANDFLYVSSCSFPPRIGRMIMEAQKWLVVNEGYKTKGGRYRWLAGSTNFDRESEGKKSRGIYFTCFNPAWGTGWQNKIGNTPRMLQKPVGKEKPIYNPPIVCIS